MRRYVLRCGGTEHSTHWVIEVLEQVDEHGVETLEIAVLEIHNLTTPLDYAEYHVHIVYSCGWVVNSAYVRRLDKVHYVDVDEVLRKLEDVLKVCEVLDYVEEVSTQ